MRLLYVINARIPSERAHGIQVMKTCEALARAGVDVTLVVPWRFKRIKGDPFAYYGVEPVFRIKRLPALDLSFMGSFGFWICSLTFVKSVFLYLLFSRYDVVYSRDELPLLVAHMMGKKIFWEGHDGRLNTLTRNVLPKLAGLIVITNGLGEFYREHGYSGSIHVSPDGVDLTDFKDPISRDEARERLGLSHGEHIVLYVGSLQSWKGCDTFLAASELLPDVRFAVIGGSLQEIRKLRERFPHVSFLGERPYKELPINQRAADVLVIPNTARTAISARFTSPLKAFAHMASDVPIVASDVPSIREVLSETNAFFFAPDDARSLADAITYVLHHPNEAHERAGTAQIDVVRYSWDNRAHGIASFIGRP